MEVPVVRFASSRAGRIAYQTWGEGGAAVLCMVDIATSVDSVWEHPARVRFLRFHGSMGRVVRFDPRGQGASDSLPVRDCDRVAEWASDIEPVLDDVGFQSVAVVAEGLAAHAALRFAAASPERVSRLALWNAQLRPSQELGADEVDALGRYVSSVWGTGEVVRRGAPRLELGADPGFFARTERLGATPTDAGALVRTMFTSSVDDVTGLISQDVLVLHSGDFPAYTADQCAALADALPHATFMTVDASGFYWGPEMAAYAEFLTGTAIDTSEREFGAVLFTDIVDSTATAARVGDGEWHRVLDDIDDFVATEVHRRGGRTVKHTGDGHLMTFPRPADAVLAATSVLRGVHAFGVVMRAGIHVGEFEQRARDDVTGITVHIAARVAQQARPDELLLSRTAADLVAGGDLVVDDRGSHKLKGVPGEWHLFAAVGV